MRSIRATVPLTFVVVTLLFSLTPGTASAVIDAFDTGTFPHPLPREWFTQSSWTYQPPQQQPPLFPDNGSDTFDVTISGPMRMYSPNSTLIPPIPTEATISNLTVLGTGELDIDGGHALRIDAGGTVGTIDNAGTIRLVAETRPGPAELLLTNGDIDLTGGGTILMGVTPPGLPTLGNNFIRWDGAVGHLTSDNTISGTGRIESRLTNNGIIDASFANHRLTVWVDGSSVNNNVMKASAGVLRLHGGQLTTAGVLDQGTAGLGGSIVADPGAQVQIVEIEIIGGDFIAPAAPVIPTLATPMVQVRGDSTIRSSAISGLMGVPDAITLTVGTTLTNNGQIDLTIDGNTTGSTLAVDGATFSFNGTGKVVMDHANDRIISGGVTSEVTNGSSHLIEGAGSITTNLINLGTINADGTDSLSITTPSNNFGNDGTLRASGVGGMTIGDTTFTNRGSVDVLLGSSFNANSTYVQQSGSTGVAGTLTSGGSFTQVGGSTTLDNASLNATSVSVQSGVFSGTGTVTAAQTTVSGGTLAPGVAGTGSLTIAGNLTQHVGGTLEMEISGPPAGTDFDVLDVTGNYLVDGTLEIQFPGGFTPLIGDRYPIITAGSLTGVFGAVTQPPLPTGMVGFIAYSSTGADYATTIAGDCDFDSEVDEADILALALAGEGEIWVGKDIAEASSPCDFDGDGVLGQDDYLELYATLGEINPDRLYVRGNLQEEHIEDSVKVYHVDNDVDTLDLTTAIINFTGAEGSGKTWLDGDNDLDGNVDTVDLTAAIGNFTGAVESPSVPDLIYDPETGNVSVAADGSDVISFSLQAELFAAADFSALPAGLTDNIETQIGWTSDDLFAGLTGTADLGAILPVGLNVAQLEAALRTASYGQALAIGGGGGRFDIMIPEPSSMFLIALSASAFMRIRKDHTLSR